MKKITEELLEELGKKYTVVRKENKIHLYGNFRDIEFEIECREGKYIIARSTIQIWCGDENNCFDKMAKNASEAELCQYTPRCAGPELFEYMPKIYVASSFKPLVRVGNRQLKDEIQKYGMFPILPQHLSQDNCARRVLGGEIAEHPEYTREKLGDVVGKWCEEMIEECQGAVAVLNRMGNDASWECGLIRGLRKPAIAIYYSDPEKDPLDGLRNDWMVRRTEFIDVVRFPENIWKGLELLRNEINQRVE